MHACRNTLLSQCVRVRACRNPRRDREEMGWRLFPDQDVTPATKTHQSTHKTRTRHAHAKCFVLDHPVSRPHKICTHDKHAIETRAGAGHTHACSQLHAPTHAAAPEHAFPALRHAFPTPQRRQRQHSTREHKHAGQRGQGTRTMRGPRCCVQCEQYASLPLPDTPMPAHSPHSSGLDAIALASGSHYNSRVQNPIPTTPEPHTNRRLFRKLCLLSRSAGVCPLRPFPTAHPVLCAILQHACLAILFVVHQPLGFWRQHHFCVFYVYDLHQPLSYGC